MVTTLIGTEARATENGGSVYPVGAETVLQGMMPPPHESGLYTFHLVYPANALVDGSGKPLPIDFKLRVFANAVKIEHNWGIPVLGGNLESMFAVPFLYEGLRVPTGPDATEKYNKFGVSNCLLVPLGVTYHKGNWHGFIQGDFYTPGFPYDKTAILNIGQHHLAAGPTGAFTYLSNKAIWEASSKADLIFNFQDRTTKYRSGDELTWEYTGMRAVSKKAAVGVNGFLYKQLTDDQVNGVAVPNGGGRGRDLAVGPEFRYFFGEHKAFAFKYTRDTLVENKPRGNSFWFQLGMPLSFGGHK
ncbi:MAG: transporter [Terracidiphilus sp.]|jgi:hypothetical protein